MSRMQDNEIDLVEIFQIVWDGKWVIISLVTLAVFLGFGYLQTSQPKFTVSVPFVVETTSVEAAEKCGVNISCIENQTGRKLLILLGSNWNLKGPVASLETKNPSSLAEYENEFERANNLLTKNAQEDAERTIASIKNELNDVLQGTETVARHMMTAMYAIKSIEAGRNVLSLGSVSIKKNPTKKRFLIALSVVFGGIVGVVFLLVSRAIRDREEQKSSM